MSKSMAADDDEDANDALGMVVFRHWDFGYFCRESLRRSASFVFFCVPKAPKTKAMRVPTFTPNWSQLITKRHEHLKNCLKTRFLDGSVPKALPRSASRAIYSELLVDFWQFWDPHRDPKIQQKWILIQNPDPGNRFFTGCSRQYHFSRFWHQIFIDFR